MTAPIAGWYADPAGDATKLRYWDGTKWTDSCMDAAAATQPPQAGTQAAPAPQPESTPQPATAAPQTAAQPTAQPQPVPQPGPTYEAAYQQPAAQAAPQVDAQAVQAAYQQPVGQAAQPGPAAGVPYGTPPNVQVDYSQTYINYADMPLYYVSPQDSTLRLVAFILALVSTVTAGWFIVPLAWMIPMTVMTWGVYKGKRPNTVAFGVCSLIFLNVVGGILLLVSTKDE